MSSPQSPLCIPDYKLSVWSGATIVIDRLAMPDPPSGSCERSLFTGLACHRELGLVT